MLSRVEGKCGRRSCLKAGIRPVPEASSDSNIDKEGEWAATGIAFISSQAGGSSNAWSRRIAAIEHVLSS